MSKRLFKILIVLGFLLAACAALFAFQPTPTATIMVANPSTIYVNSTTTVIFTAQISDSRVIAGGVNLLEVDPLTGSQTVVGNLHDDGLNGDVAAGDGIFTSLLQPPTNAPTLFTYQVSAAFRGVLKRILSGAVTVAVAPVGVVLPPDPGPAGTITLGGIDSDADGVRDDIQRWIAVTEPSSARMRAAVTQGALGIQQALFSTSSSSQAIAAIDAEGNAQECLAGLMGSIKPAGAVMRMLESIALNTPARITAYLIANSMNSGTADAAPPLDQRLTLCSFNPSTLPN